MKKGLFLVFGTLALAACSQVEQPNQLGTSPTVQPEHYTVLGVLKMEVKSDSEGKLTASSNFYPNQKEFSAQSRPLMLPPFSVTVSTDPAWVDDANSVIGTKGRQAVVQNDDYASGTRYNTTIFKVSNNLSTQFPNIAFIALNTGSTPGNGYLATLGNTAIANLKSQSAMVLPDTIARGMLPSHTMRRTFAGYEVDPNFADLQFFTEAEASAIQNAASLSGSTTWPNGTDTTVLNYGYVARNVNGGRLIGANPNFPSSCAGNVQCSGLVSFSYKSVLSAGPVTSARLTNETPNSYTVYYLVTNSVKYRMSQSVEELSDANGVYSRKALYANQSSGNSFFINQVAVLPGSAYVGGDRFVVCDVMFAGTRIGGVLTKQATLQGVGPTTGCTP